MVSFMFEINVQLCLVRSTFNVDVAKKVLLDIVGFRGTIAMLRCRPGSSLLHAVSIRMCVCV